MVIALVPGGAMMHLCSRSCTASYRLTIVATTFSVSVREETIMRLIVKPLGAIVIVLALGGSFFALARGFSSAGRSPFAAVRASAKGSAKNLVSDANWKFYTEHGTAGNLEKTTASPAGTPLTSLHVVVANRTNQNWNIGLSNPLRVSFKPNEKVTLHFWARAEKPSKFSVVLQKNTPGFPTYFAKECEVGTGWKEFSAEVATPAVAHYESMMAFHLGYQTGWVEICGVELAR
jgi:hypothetical protein